MAKDYGIGQQIEEQQIDVYVPEYDVTVKASPAASANVVNNLARMKVGGGQKGFNTVGGLEGTCVGDAWRSYVKRVSEEKSDLNPAWWDALSGFGEGFVKGVARFPMDISAQIYDLYTSGSNYMSEAIYKSDVKGKKDRIAELQARIKSFEGLDEEKRTKATKYYTDEIAKLQDELKNLESDNFRKYLLETQKERKKASDAYAEKIDEIVGMPKSDVASGFESVMTSLLFAPAGAVGLGVAYGAAGAGELLTEMKEKGVDSDEAMRWSTIGGGLIGWVNTIGDKFILTKAVENITAKSGLMAILRGATSGGIGEFVEESGESLSTDIVKEIAGINEKSAGQVVGDAILSGIMGFITGFVFGGGSSGLEIKWKKEEREKNIEKFKNTGLSQETSEKIADRIFEAEDSDSIKEEIANLITEDIDPSKYKDADMQKDIDETVSVIPEMMNRFLMQNEVEIPKAEVEETKTPVEEKEVYTISGVDVSKETMPKLHDLLYQAEASGSPITTIAEALQKINEVSKFGEKQKLRGQLENIQQSITNKLQRRFGEAYGRSVGQVVAANVYAGAKLNGVTPEQYYQTMFPKTNLNLKSVEDLAETDEIPYQSGSNGFKEWFGKSEAVDENGNPKKMYHWTPYEFDIFKIADNDVGFHVGSSEQAERIKEIDRRKGEKKEIFIRVENPLELEDAGMWAANSTFVNQLVEKNIITEEEAQNIITSKDMSMKEKTTFLRDKIKEKGYDSIKYKNEYEKDGEYSYILFDENQAKYTNNKTYSRTSKDMRYQELGETPRGAFDPKQNFVYLFENADRSTFLHEMAHAWMDIVVNGKTERAKAIKKAIDEFIGNKGEPYTKAQLEKFAEGFEVYCSEGKAPNNFLKNAFRNFRNWLVGLWKSIKSPDVQLNDEIRQVYKDMLGGNDVDTVFSDDAGLTEIEDMVAKIEAIEAKRQEERAKKIEESADAVAEATEQSNSVKQYVGNVIDKKKKEASAFSKAFEYALKPISTRAKEVDPAFALRIRKYMLDEYNFVNKYAGMVKPLFDAYNNMDIKDRAKLDIYMKNAYQDGIDSIVQKYGIEDEYKAFRDAMEGIYQKAIDVGLQMNHRDVYAPRRVKDKQEFLEYMNSAYASLMSQMKEELGDGASIDQKAEWLDQHLRTSFKSDPMKSIPGNAKERTVDVITPELNKYYYNTMDSIAMYIENMAQAINLRNMWGATKDTMGKNEGLDKSIGEVIAHLKEEGRIETIEEENEVRSILDALLGNHGNTNAIVSAIKSGAYINMLTRGSQTISQLADIGTSAYRNGLIRTLQAMFGRNITIEDVGIEKLTEELRTKEGVQKWLELGLKVTGFSALDVWGKNTYLNARYNKLQAMAKKNPTKLKSELEWAWEDETDALIDDLAKGEWTERVQLLMFSELSEVQPTTKAEMPAGYLNNPNGRVLYMLKTFAIRRMDMILNDTVRLWKEGNKQQAVSNIVFISLLMGGAEALVSILRDFIKGKPLDLNDATIEAMLGLVMMNRYQVYKASEEGWSGLAATFLPPMFPMESAFIEDMFNIVQKDMNLKDMRTWSYIPLIGDAYYWWIGGGYEKNKKKRLKK